MKKIMFAAISLIGIPLMFNEAIAINRQALPLPQNEEKLFSPLLLADISINRITDYGGIQAGTINPAIPNTNPLPIDTPPVLTEVEMPPPIVNTSNINLSGTSTKTALLSAPALIAEGNELDNSLIGNELNNTLKGLAGNDTLDGGRGADRLEGGQGNDTYYVDNTGDRVVENSNEGVDIIYSTVNYTLGANQEELFLQAGAKQGTGNNLNNKLIGNDLDNHLNGGGGDDYLKGAKGDDTYYIDSTGDTVVENSNEGIDTIHSTVNYTLGNNQENLFLEGGANYGAGNHLNNELIGGSGNNTLTGGSGNDTFKFTRSPSSFMDTITDFSVANDKIAFDRTIYNKFDGHISAENFRSDFHATTASGKNNYLIYNKTDGKLYYDPDGGWGIAPSVQIAQLSADLSLTTANFTLD
jgi:Ca2+-binding RTX toxin-like protein